jgi:alpha-galactosidase
MMAHVRKVLADPGRVVPDYDARQGYELAGFVWFQGWNDMVDGSVYPMRGSPGSYDAYSQLLATFIRDVRRELEAPHLPFVIGVMGTNGPIENLEPRYQTIHAEFRRAMAAPAAMPAFRGDVIAVQTAPFWDMRLDAVAKQRDRLNARKRSLEQLVERGDASQAAIAEAVAEITDALASPEIQGLWNRGGSNAAYHYFGCGKTMALIGRAFADGIIAISPKLE